MIIGIASDHRGVHLKQAIIKELQKHNYTIKNYGTDKTESADFPDYAVALSKAVIAKEVEFGIAICGTGIGMSIACNKISGIRCAKIDSIIDAKMAKQHNYANIIAFGEKTTLRKALKMIMIYIKESNNLEEKYQRRNKKIIMLEKSK